MRKIAVFLALTMSAAVFTGLFACGGNESNTVTPGGDSEDKWTIERVYETAADMGFEGSLEDLIALFKGEQGAPGKDGEDGAPGEDGEDGLDGKDGVGIENIEIDKNGCLIITLTDKRVINCGKVTAPESGSGEAENTQCLEFYPLDDGTYAVSIGNAEFLSSIVIPESYLNKPVSTVMEKGFESAKNLKSVSIPDSVTEIGEGAFRSCENLRTVKINKGSSLEKIGIGAFNGCDMRDFTLPQNLKEIGSGAFINCNRLVEIYNYSSVELIEGNKDSMVHGGIEYNALGIYDGDTPSKVVTYGDFKFYDGETKHLLEYVGADKDITLPDDFKGSEYAIHNYAFRKTSLNSVSVNDGCKLTAIGEYAFSGCKFTSFELAKSVKHIGKYAFSGCTESAFTIPKDNSLVSIGDYAFESCFELRTFYLPESVTTVGKDIFDNTETMQIYVWAYSRPAGWDSEWILPYKEREEVTWGYRDF